MLPSLMVVGILGLLAHAVALVLLLSFRRGPPEGLREWVGEGYALAEVSAARALRENKTRHTPADKRETALAWARSRVEASGMVWTDAMARECARMVEIHHGKFQGEKALNLSKSQN